MSRMTFRYWPVIAALFVATWANADPSPALGTVDRFQATLLEVMKQGSALDYSTRSDRLLTAVTEDFDVDYVARKVIDAHWASLAPEQRAQFQAQLTRMAVATLAARFNSYRGEEFRIVSSETFASGKEYIRCAYRYPEGDEVKVDYLLHETPQGWQIVNVWFDGVSVTSIQREEFSRVIETEGFDSLVAKFEQRIAHYESGGN